MSSEPHLHPRIVGSRRLYRFRYVLLALYAVAYLGSFYAFAGTREVFDLQFPWEIVIGGAVVLFVLQALFLSGAPHFRWPRPTRGRPMWVSLAVGALVAGLLTAGLAGTVVSLFQAEAVVSHLDEALGPPGRPFTFGGLSGTVVAFVLLMWVGWLVVFGFVWAGEWSSKFGRVYRLLFVGSWLELLVTIPVDVQVRKRTKCYCGEGTFFALIVGMAAALWAFGPGLVLLFFARRLQRRTVGSICLSCGYDLRGLSGLADPRCPECGTPFDPARLKGTVAVAIDPPAARPHD